MLDTPPLILQPGHNRLISRVALQHMTRGQSLNVSAHLPRAVVTYKGRQIRCQIGQIQVLCGRSSRQRKAAACTTLLLSANQYLHLLHHSCNHSMWTTHTDFFLNYDYYYYYYYYKSCVPDEVDGVVVVLRKAGADGENVGVEDHVFRIEANVLHQDFVTAAADAHLRMWYHMVLKTHRCSVGRNQLQCRVAAAPTQMVDRALVT